MYTGGNGGLVGHGIVSFLSKKVRNGMVTQYSHNHIYVLPPKVISVLTTLKNAKKVK